MPKARMYSRIRQNAEPSGTAVAAISGAGHRPAIAGRREAWIATASAIAVDSRPRDTSWKKPERACPASAAGRPPRVPRRRTGWKTGCQVNSAYTTLSIGSGNRRKHCRNGQAGWTEARRSRLGILSTVSHEKNISATTTVSATRRTCGHAGPSPENRPVSVSQNTASASASSSTTSASTGTQNTTERNATPIFARFCAATPRQGRRETAAPSGKTVRAGSPAPSRRRRGRRAAAPRRCPPARTAPPRCGGGIASWLTAKRKPFR